MVSSYRIAYIISLPHSGSTLLDSLMGAHSKALSVGEIDKIRSYALTLREKSAKSVLGNQCTCGAPTIWGCTFWQDVDKCMRAVAGLSLKGIDPDSADPNIFARDNRTLFDAIAAVSGAEIIVDSSKNRTRYIRLNAAGFTSLLPIHLLRDPRGQIKSIVARTGRMPYRSALRYSLSTAQTVFALRGIDHLRVGYESIASSPEATLARIMRYLGLEFEPGQLDWAGLPRHNIGGNHRRSTRDSTVTPDESWRDALSQRQQLGIRFITYPVRRLLWRENLAQISHRR